MSLKRVVTSLLALLGSLPFFSASPSFFTSFSPSLTASSVFAESSTTNRFTCYNVSFSWRVRSCRGRVFVCVCVTWSWRVGLSVGRRPGGRGLSGGVGLSRGSLVLLQLGHPGHRPLTVHVFELLDLKDATSSMGSERGLFVYRPCDHPELCFFYLFANK